MSLYQVCILKLYHNLSFCMNYFIMHFVFHTSATRFLLTSQAFQSSRLSTPFMNKAAREPLLLFFAFTYIFYPVLPILFWQTKMSIRWQFHSILIFSLARFEAVSFFILLYLSDDSSALYINERRFCGRCTLKTESQYRRLYRFLRTVCGDRSTPTG